MVRSPSTHSVSSPMPVDPPFNVYCDELTSLSQGLALWNPNPPKDIYNNVSIGDVGYLHEGTFIRMFNVMLPWDDPSNRTLGNPEPFNTLYGDPIINIQKSDLDGGYYCSHYVSVETNAGYMKGMRPVK